MSGFLLLWVSQGNSIEQRTKSFLLVYVHYCIFIRTVPFLLETISWVPSIEPNFIGEETNWILSFQIVNWWIVNWWIVNSQFWNHNSQIHLSAVWKFIIQIYFFVYSHKNHAQLVGLYEWDSSIISYNYHGFQK